MANKAFKTIVCEVCGGEADIIIKELKAEATGKEVSLPPTLVCKLCGSEADLVFEPGERAATATTGGRVERDFLGEKEVPQDAYYGIETLRAIENFPISGLRPHPKLIKATALIKLAAAETNMALGWLDPQVGNAIAHAAREIAEGRWHEQFMVDTFQAGAGTSHNMNANEVIANRAIEILGGRKGDYWLVHPHDHVNMGQSTNDVFPTTIRLAVLALGKELVVALQALKGALTAKAAEFDDVVKPGRTHLQDAVPILLGQEFAAYAAAVGRGRQRVEQALFFLEELNIGATAVGTGITSHPRYRQEIIARLRAATGWELRPAPNLVEATQSTSDLAHLSSALKLLALELIRIANDLRLMSSGPRTGLGEINLPPVQPGSSIMPGKINPVMAEMLDMVAFQVVGNDVTIALATQAGQLELNVMMPVIASNLLFSLGILKNAVRVFTQRCVLGITANREHCQQQAEQSPELATALSPYLGYEAAAEIAQEAAHSRRSVREVALDKKLLSLEQADRILDLRRLTQLPKEE